MNHKKWTCETCGCDPDARDLERIESDLAASRIPTVAWHCPRCAPDLELAPSGLAWNVVDVVGSSPHGGTK